MAVSFELLNYYVQTAYFYGETLNMPLKWKIYYLCSLYLFLWIMANVCLLVYLIVFRHGSIANPEISIFLIAVVFGSIAVKAFLSLQFIGLLKNGDIFTVNQEKTFNFLRYAVILLSVISAFKLIFQLPKDISRFKYIGSLEIIQSGFLIFATACAIYLCIMDDALTAFLRKKYDEGIAALGEEIEVPSEESL